MTGMNTSTNIRLYGAEPDSIVDGPGLRYAIFVQGCTHGCPGCHNPDSQPHEGGAATTVDALFDDIRANGLVHDVTFSGGEPFEQAAACAELARRLKDLGYGIWTYTGYRYEDHSRIAAAAEQAATADRAVEADGAGAAKRSGEADDAGAVGQPREKNGVERSAAAGDESAPACADCTRTSFKLDARGVRDLLDCTDVLVDGPFVASLKSLGLRWCGSSNQRLIDVPATRAAGEIVTWQPPTFVPEKPASW